MAIALDTLAYANRLKEAGFSEQQAEGQARALAEAMTDSLATKQDLRELATATKQDLRELEARVDARFVAIDARFEYLEKHIDTRLAELEKRVEIRFGEQAARFNATLENVERRMTIRLGTMMLASIGVVSTLMRLL